MHRRARNSLFVAATLLLTITACDPGADTKAAAKDSGKAAADDGAKVEADKTEEGGAADAGKIEEPIKTEADEDAEAADAAAADEGGEVAAAGDTDGAAAADDAGEKEDGDEGEKDPPKDPPKEAPKDPPKDPPKEATANVDAKSIFSGKCKSCHGADGKGDTTIGKKVDIPSLAGTSLSKAKIVSTIENGVPDTKMKGYKDKLSKEEIDAVAAYVKKL
jgi:mono/diheme cytochrome c family protein